MILFASTGANTEVLEGSTLLSDIQKSGLIGAIIIGLSIVALVLVVMHSIQIRRTALLPTSQVAAIREMLGAGRVDASLEYCMLAENDSFLTRILTPGLTRFLKSPFGAFEIKAAIEDAGSEQTARLYRTTDGLGIIGTIAPLLGLLGTVQGMIGAFDTVGTSAVNDSNYYASLASNISLALITTMLGLIVAIPCVILFTVFRNRIDTIAAEAGQELDHMVLLLESSSGAQPRPNTGAARGMGTPARPSVEGGA